MRPLLVVLLLLVSMTAHAQTSTQRLAFTHNGLNTTRYELKVDTGTPIVVVATPLAGVPGDLTVPWPVLTPGSHTLTLTACNSGACSLPGTLAVIQPNSPTAMRLVITITVP